MRPVPIRACGGRLRPRAISGIAAGAELHDREHVEVGLHHHSVFQF